MFVYPVLKEQTLSKNKDFKIQTNRGNKGAIEGMY